MSISIIVTFQEGIEPKWEAVDNIAGGYWMALLKNVDKEKMDKIWLYSVLACIGGDFGSDEYDCISGLFLNIRNPGNKIQLWLRTTDKEPVYRIGYRFAEILDAKELKLVFIPCAMAMKGNSAALYTIS